MIERLTREMKEAMKSRDTERLGTIRMLLSTLKNERIAKMEDLTDEEITTVLHRELKRRIEAAEIYRKGERDDLAEKEEREGDIIRAYLPEPLEGEALEEAVKSAIKEAGASSMRDFGKVMKEVMNAHRGRVGGKEVQEVVKRLLAQ